jgi:hypothetical protein
VREITSYEATYVSGGRELTGQEWIGIGLIGLNSAYIGKFIGGPVVAAMFSCGSVGSLVLLCYLDII